MEKSGDSAANGDEKAKRKIAAIKKSDREKSAKYRRRKRNLQR